MTPRHLVVGPGALGRMLAHALADRYPVKLVARRALPERQTLTTPEGRTLTRQLPIVRLERLTPAQAPAFIHLTTKAYAADDAADALAERLGPGIPLVLWQNGFAVQPRLSERWPGPVLCASTTEGAYALDDASMVHAGRGESLVGGLDGRHAETAQMLVDDLNRAGMTADAVDDIDTRLWRKLAVNAAINPLVALNNVPNGALEDARFHRELDAAIAETAAILAALDVAPPEGAGVDGWRRLVNRVIHATAGNRASMLQDLDAGRPTERNAILGPLIEQARQHRLPCPQLEALNTRLADREAAQRQER